MSRARTVFLGSGPFGVAALRRLSEHARIELVGVVTAPARPTGRHKVETPTPVEIAARDLGAPLVTPPRLRTADAVASVLALDPALIVLADYGQIVPAAILDVPNGALNLHPSLLPRYRGASPVPAAILAGDTETGVTLMRMDEGLDTGPIVAAERVSLAGTETAPDLESRLAGVAAELLARSVGPWLDGQLAPVPQPAEGATLTRPLRREDGRLNPSSPAVELERRIRAYTPWPGTFLETRIGRLIVHAAHVESAEPVDAAGTIVANGDGIAVATADGRLVLDEVQPAGGNRMSGAALRRGRPGVVDR